MSHPPVIVDTNVVVAGLLSGNDTLVSAKILNGMLSAMFPFVVSEALLAEYRTVLLRPHLGQRHGLQAADVDTLLTHITQHAIVLQPVPAPPAPDPNDQLLWELLAARADVLLVTADKLLLQHRRMRARVMTVDNFWDLALKERAR